MKARDDMITTRSFDSYPKDLGLVLDFSDVAALLPKDAGEGYVPATHWRLHNTFSGGDEDKAVKTRRNIDAEARTIGFYQDEEQDDLVDIGASAMIVKRVGQMHLTLPQTFDFALSRVHAAAFDALKLYGPELFEQTQMMFIVQRTDIEPQEAHRNNFANWHSHSSSNENYDMLYSFFNTLGTEVKTSTHHGQRITEVEMTAPNNSILRIGAEVSHRSQVNTSKEDIRREWGALTINVEQPKSQRNQNYLSTNRVMVDRDDPNFDVFKDKAADILVSDASLQVLEEPETLLDVTDAEAEYSL